MTDGTRTGGSGDGTDPAAQPPERPATGESRDVTGGDPGLSEEEATEFGVKARTQSELVWRRFLRHRGALSGLTLLAAVILLAITSIGFGPIPGWWDQTFSSTGLQVDGGRPTMDVLPSFVDGDGFAIGEHPFGQDDIGRDYFALTMRGAQQSLQIAFLVGIVSTIVGAAVGALAGYFGGWVETLLMRLTDIVISVPLLVLAAVLGRSVSDGSGGTVLPLVDQITALGIFLGLILWTTLARLVRGEVLSLKEREFVEAARAMGASPFRIITRHILPNTVSTIVVFATLTIATAILLETALSFLGLGVQPPDTSLGRLIVDYQTAFATRPWLFWFPGLFIIAIALSINFIGDGLRDAFDPRQTRVRQ